MESPNRLSLECEGINKLTHPQIGTSNSDASEQIVIRYRTDKKEVMDSTNGLAGSDIAHPRRESNIGKMLRPQRLLRVVNIDHDCHFRMRG
jgi:hypothetical protein